MIKRIILCLLAVLVCGCAANIQNNNKFLWVKAKPDYLPRDMIVVAFDHGKPTGICRTKYLDGIHPGQLTANGCLISYGVSAFIEKDYEVLVGNNNQVIWDIASVNFSDSRYFSPILGGYEPSKKRQLYICRAMYHNRIYVGKVVDDRCNIGIDGEEGRLSQFETLFVVRSDHYATKY